MVVEDESILDLIPNLERPSNEFTSLWSVAGREYAGFHLIQRLYKQIFTNPVW